MGKDRKPRTVIGPGTGKSFRGKDPDRQFIPVQRKAWQLRDAHLERVALKHDRRSRDRIRMQKGLI